ncbi:tetratricopeptide repeat protein, partial [bacterium]
LVTLIILLGFAVYANSLHGQFIWDDGVFIKHNAYIGDWHKLNQIFTGDSGAGSSVKMNCYRPIQMLTYMADHSLWGLNVFGYHLTSVILHIAVALAVYWLVLLLFGSIPFSFFTSILFVAHPVNTETVSYISGRADILSALFILLFLISYIKNNSQLNLKFYILMLSSCVLAFLSKENALVIMPLLLLYHYIFRQRIKGRLFLPPLIISLFYILLRPVRLLSFSFGPVLIIKRIPGFFAALANYLKVLLLPLNLHMEYGNRLFNIIQPQVLFGLGTFIFLLFLALRGRDTKRVISFAILWFFAALLPTTSIYPVHSFYMTEHWLYLPSIGFFLLLGWGLSLLYENKNYRFAALGLLACLLFSYSYLTVKQNNYWRDELGFYKRTLEYTPDSPMVHNNLGNIYLGAGDEAGAIKEYLKAIKFDPRLAEAYYNLGNAYHNLGKIDKATELMRKAIELDPAYLEAYNDLASDYADTGNIEEALKLWNEAVRLDPGFATAHFNLSQYYFKRKQYDLALFHCDKVLELGYQVDRRFLKELEPFRGDKNR